MHPTWVSSGPKGQFEWCSSKERELKVFSMPEGEVLFDNSHWWYLFVCSVTQSCPTLCNSMDCSLPDSSVHGIFQARMLEWVGISFSNWYVWLVVWGGTETTVSSLETVSLDPSGRHWSFFCSAMSKYWHCMPKHSRISVYTQSHSLSDAQTTTVTGLYAVCSWATYCVQR